MTNSHAAGWPENAPTAAQLKEFFAQIESGRITKEGLQGFLGSTIVLTDELTLRIPALPRPTLAALQDILKLECIECIERIERDTSPTEAVTLRLGTVLREGEDSVGGAEYERRLQPKLSILLGYQQAQWLVAHQDEHPAFMALLGKVYIDFPGLVVVAGSRRVPYLFCQDGNCWGLRWSWFKDAVRGDVRVAVSSPDASAGAGK